MNEPEGRAQGNTAWWSALLALCVILLVPLLLVEVPPLLDYPNHLARLFVLAFVQNDPVLGRFYEPRWGIIPNLGLDLTVPPLLRLFPVHLVGRAVVGVALLLPVFGSISYHRALTKRVSYWPLCSVLFVYNAALLRGFLNFIISVGIAMLLGAAWVKWRESRPVLAIVTAAIGAVTLFFCHLTGLLFFAILIGAHELALLRTTPLTIVWLLRRSAGFLASFAVPALLYALSDLRQMRSAAVFRSLPDKAHSTLMPVLNYYFPLDLVTGVVCVVVPAVCLARGWCRVPLEAALALVVVILLFLVLPTAFKGTFDLDTRFIVMASFLLPAALVSVALPPRTANTLVAALVLLFTARITIVASVWGAWASDLSAFRSVIDSVHPGDVVLTLRTPREKPNIWTSIATARTLSDGTPVDAHLPALLVIEHRAWWPFLFNNPSQQPIESHEPYRSMGRLIDISPHPISLLVNGPSEMRLITHVLVLGPAPDRDLVSEAGLRRIAGNADETLYAVDRGEISLQPPPAPPSAR